MTFRPDAGLDAVASLAQPHRRALYRYVATATEPVSRDQAAGDVGVPRHVAKFHLDRLVEDGLLDAGYSRPPGRSGPGAGRPAKLYRRSSRQLEISVPARRYEVAARLLAEAVRTATDAGIPVGTAVSRVAREAGRAIGERARQHVGARPSRAKVASLATEVLVDYGYEPQATARGMVLGNCPFHSLARDHTDLVCGMNLALIDGVFRGLQIDRLEAVLDPAPGRCCVQVTRHAGPTLAEPPVAPA